MVQETAAASVVKPVTAAVSDVWMASECPIGTPTSEVCGRLQNWACNSQTLHSGPVLGRVFACNSDRSSNGRLLDIATLLADGNLAELCSKHCRPLPLRRWRLQDLVGFSTRPPLRNGCWIRLPSLLRAALAAGLDFQHLQDSCFQMPLRQMILLFGHQTVCREIVKLLPKPSTAWHPPLGFEWGRRCFSQVSTSSAGLLDVEHLEAARRDGLDLTVYTWYATKFCGCSVERVEWPIMDLAAAKLQRRFACPRRLKQGLS